MLVYSRVANCVSHRNQGFEKLGLVVQPNNDIIYREWAPNAHEAFLVGDFSKKLRNDYI